MVRKNTRILGVAPRPKHKVSTHGACNLGTQAIMAAAGSLRSGVGRSEHFPPQFSGPGGNGNHGACNVATKAVKAAAGSFCSGVG